MNTHTFNVMGYTGRATGARVEIFQGSELLAIVAIHGSGIYTVTEWARAGAGRLPAELRGDLVRSTEYALRCYWGTPAQEKAA